MRGYGKIHREHYVLKFFMKIIGIFAIATLSIVLYDIYSNINIENTPITGDVVVAKEESENDNISNILEKVSQAVVGISKLQSVDSSFFSLEATETYNLGTGVIIAKEGYILTNHHVSGNRLTRCYITLEDGKEYTAQVVWTDENLDLSILKMNTTREINYAKMGDSDKLKIAQEVYAIGNPLGTEFDKTITYGIISALNRTIKIEDKDSKNSYMEELIQTDASINYGNSGGPLVDKDGNVIGITSIKITDAEGIGFAIPINIIKPIVDKLVETGKYEEASLGVYVYDKEAIKYINQSLEFDNGVYVTELIPGGAGKSAGIRVGDIIEKIDDITLNRINDLRRYIYTKDIGDEVKLTILRGKQEIEITARLNRKM